MVRYVAIVLGSLLCILPVSSAQRMEVMYDQFWQLNGTNVIDFQLRVRKVNRTTAALGGTIIFARELSNDYLFGVDLFHSSKGNQQFNHYPMKIPSTGACDFTHLVWPDYYPYYNVSCTDNMLKVNDCPIQPRTVVMTDHILDVRMLPPYIPSGLWKVYFKVQKDDETLMLVACTVRVFGEDILG